MITSNLHYDEAIISDVGMLRPNNEDCGLVLNLTTCLESREQSAGLYMVLDGMGGEKAGEIASSKVMTEVSKKIWDSLSVGTGNGFNNLIRLAIEKANSKIYRLAADNSAYSAMGTTITLGLRIGQELYIGHVGDSRAYHIRKSNITQLTEDHSLVATLLKKGMITKDEAQTHSQRGKIFRSVGSVPDVIVDSLKDEKLLLADGDILVFCTDGLVNNVTDEELIAEVTAGKTAYDACLRLTVLANARGGEDNITVIVVKAAALRP